MNTLSLILAVAGVVCGVMYFYDFFKDRPLRRKMLHEALRINPNLSKKERTRISEGNGIIFQLGALFPVILIVFLFRAFLFEPFRIPSGSMEPTLLPGDFIAVQKTAYGIRNPFTNEVMIETGTPERGDVVVFKYPEDPDIDYIKRVVGLPGDEVIFTKDKRVYLRKSCIKRANCPVPNVLERVPVGLDEGYEALYGNEQVEVYEETLGNVKHRILQNPRVPDLSSYFYKQGALPRGRWIVPEGHYFVLGDNRDNSKDSRFWGFVPESYLVGKTVCIWLSLEFEHDAESILPAWFPSGIRFSRIGGLD